MGVERERVPADDERSSDLRVLKVVAVLVPVVFVGAVELVRYFIVEDRYQEYGAHAIPHLILAVFTLAAVLTFAFVMFGYIERAQRATVRRSRELAILTERDQIAREMHDVDAQVLAAIHLRLRSLAARMPADDALRGETVAIADAAEDAYRDVREALLGLRQSVGSERGFLDSLGSYLDRFSHQSGVRTSLVSHAGPDLTVPVDVEIQLIRVIQEALANVRKHAHASSATVQINAGDDVITVVIADAGRGFDLGAQRAAGEHYGLSTMRERMSLVGGTLTVESSPARGTRVIASVPRHQPDMSSAGHDGRHHNRHEGRHRADQQPSIGGGQAEGLVIATVQDTHHA